MTKQEAVAWLIECPKGFIFEHGAGFWCGHRADESEMVWSKSALDAVRFVRKEDAENTLRIMRHYLSKFDRRDYDVMYVAEHMWCAHPPSTEQERASHEARQ